MSYAVRFTKSYNDVSGVVKEIAEKSEKSIVYEHTDGARLHCHMLIIGYEKASDTLRRKLRSMFTNPARSDISIKQTYSDASGIQVDVDDTFIVYMSKGQYDPQYVKGYTGDEIQTYRSRWVDYTPKKGLKVRNGKIVVDGVGDDSSPRRGQKTKWELLKEMDEEWNSGVPPAFDDLFDLVRKILKRNHQAIGYYKVMDYMESYLYNFQEGKAREMVRVMWDRKFSRF